MKVMKSGILGVIAAVGVACGAQAAAYLSPEYLALAPDGKTVYVTAATASKLFLFDAAGSKMTGEWSL